MTKKYQSKSAERAHKTMAGLFRLNLITKKDMEEFDEMCLVQKEKKPVKKIHKLNGRAKIAKQNILEKAS